MAMYLNCIWIKNGSVSVLEICSCMYLYWILEKPRICIWFGQVVFDSKMCVWTQPWIATELVRTNEYAVLRDMIVDAWNRHGT